MKQVVWLRRQVQAEAMTDSVRRRLEFELERLAQIDGQGFDPDEAALIVEIVGEAPSVELCAPLDALWPYRKLFLTACLYVAVADGRYSIEQSRHISQLAQNLGWSVRQLSELERVVLNDLEERGRLLMIAG